MHIFIDTCTCSTRISVSEIHVKDPDAGIHDKKKNKQKNIK